MMLAVSRSIARLCRHYSSSLRAMTLIQCCSDSRPSNKYPDGCCTDGSYGVRCKGPFSCTSAHQACRFLTPRGEFGTARATQDAPYRSAHNSRNPARQEARVRPRRSLETPVTTTRRICVLFKDAENLDDDR